MRSFSVIVSVLLFAVVVQSNYIDSERFLFNRFINDYQKSYSAEEYDARFANFKNTLKRIDELNNNPTQLATFAINKFSDLTPEEFSAYYLMPKFSPNDTCIWPYHRIAKEFSPIELESIPTSWNWTSKGCVTPVKNQEDCGSCWTFSTTGNIEGQWQLYGKGNELVGLSEQYLVDCSNSCLASDPALCNAGCNGGLPWLAYEGIIKAKGIVTEAAYPYTGEDGTCGKDTPIGATISNWTAVSTDPTQIQAFMYSQGPLSVTLNADLLMSYSSGVLSGTDSDCPNDGSDHAVLLVGYGTDAGTNYWLVKNSWGEDWGLDGYFMITSDDGLCGINACVTSALIK